jgi:hypothetical protein
MVEEKAFPPHEKEDIPLYRSVVWILGIISILALSGIITLTIFGKPIPESLVALGSASVGALTGLLAPPPA